MKIAYLAKTIDHGSGGGRYALSVVKVARGLGLEVEVFKEEDDGHEGQAVLRRGLGIIQSSLKLRKLVKSFDVVHSLDVWPYGVHAYLSVIGTDKKLFVSGVGTYSVLPLESPLKKLILRPILKRAGKIFCISHYVKEEMARRLPLDNLAVVNLAHTELPAFSGEELERYRQAYEVDRSKYPILLTVGAVKHRKGQLDTVKAVAKLTKKYPNLLYIMVGTTDEHAYIREISKFAKANGLEGYIKIVGDAKSDKALSFFYSISDVFVMNSNNDHGHFEGFGMVFLEAASFGKPVVGSSNCGIEDALLDGYNGYLAKQGDSEDIAGKIDLALQNRSALGKNSLEFAKRFSWQKTVEKYLESYRRP
ncbi:glycosyltransferase family 4 protein [Candidatus Parcubacteria bacterium]|nr:glycosyltransferase family 4 protein [Candidatus Parcubacteria bacterium]